MNAAGRTDAVRHRGSWTWVTCLALAVLMLAGCTNTPPPPLVSAPAQPPGSVHPTDLDQVVVAVDRFADGVNPHQIADQSTLTTALAQEMLPSVFRPAADGTPRLDRTVMESARVSSSEPFTVTYTIRPDAAWSDGVPVRAEDFQYLHDQMVSQPGVVDPAGYRMITNISSSEGGRVVQVQFAHPYPGWRSLFSDLLPGHILKDTPGGWDSAFTDGYPASAGPFMLGSFDRGRGEITLDRNDRYWATPSRIAHLVLRKSDIGGVTDTLRTGDAQLATVSSDTGTANALAKLGNTVHIQPLPRDEVAQLNLRPIGQLGNEHVRAAIAAALNRAALIKAGGGDRSRRVDSLTTAPGDPDYQPTMPADAPGANPSPATVRTELTRAGYEKTAGEWSLPTVNVAAPAGDQPYLAIARETVAELTKAGIPAKLLTPPAGQLYGNVLTQPQTPDKQVNVLVAPRSEGGDPATTLASWYGCPGTRADGSSYPDNPGAVCLTDLQPRIEQALRGRHLLSVMLPGIEDRIWARAVALPLFQITDLLAVRHDISGVRPNPPNVAPFPSATDWQRQAR